MKYGIIYSAINIVNGKRYIGQTIRSFEKRISEHKRDSKYLSYPFYNAIRKYGWENFKWNIVYDKIPFEQLDNMERWSIANYNTLVDFNFGYNAEMGGNNNKTPSKKTKNKISKSTIGRIPWNKGITHSEETRVKLRVARIKQGLVMTEDTKRKISESLCGENNPFYGKTHSKRTREILSEFHKGVKMSDETRQKMSLSKIGHKHSEETKKKMSISAQRRTKK